MIEVAEVDDEVRLVKMVDGGVKLLKDMEHEFNIFHRSF